MKLTFIMIMGFTLASFAEGRAQTERINFKIDRIPAEMVIQQLKELTHYRFLYNHEEIKQLPTKQIELKEATIEEVLQVFLAGSKLNYTIEDDVIIISPKLKKQPSQQVKAIRITGKVRDEQKQSLPGVTIQVKGTEFGAATDMNGTYTLSIPNNIGQNFTLVFSFVGMQTQEIAYTGKDTIDVVLRENVKAVDEVVVVGYGTTKQKDFTGSVSSVKTREIRDVPFISVDDALAGKASGVSVVKADGSPGGAVRIRIRGGASLLGTNDPLYVIDGIPTVVSDNYINGQSDITNPLEAANYGDDFNNSVEGAFSRGLNNLSGLNIADIESIDILKDASATALYGSRAASGVIVVERKKLAEGSMRVFYNFTGNVQFPYLKDYNMLNAAQKLEYERLAGLYSTEVKRDPWGNITNEGEQYALDKLYNERYQEVQRGVDTDWLSQPARTAFSHDHSLRLYGGASNVRYELSGRFNNVQGVMKEDYRRRYNLGFKLEYHVQNKLTMANRTTYSEVNYKQSPYGSFSKYVEMNPYDRIYNEFGEYNRNLSWDMDNPLYEASLGNYDISKDKSFSNTTDFRWEINKLFRLSGNFNITVSNSNNEVFKSPDSQDFKTETELSKKGSLTQKNGSGVSYAGTLTGAFNLMTDNNSLYSVNAGVEIRKETSESSTMTGVGFYDDALNFMGQAAGYSDKTDQKPTGTQAISTELGFFVNANYMYNNRYYADVVYRVTGSSKFGANNRYGNFWSAGLGWNIHNESFVTSSKIDILKIRGSLGCTGKVNFSPFQAMTMYQYTHVSVHNTATVCQ